MSLTAQMMSGYVDSDASISMTVCRRIQYRRSYQHAMMDEIWTKVYGYVV